MTTTDTDKQDAAIAEWREMTARRRPLADLHEHPSSCRAGHVYVADPGKWAGVMVDWFCVFDAVGWTYCPATEQSQPMFTRADGVQGLRVAGDFIAVVKRWPGIRFGTWQYENAENADVPEQVRRAVERQRHVWSVMLQAPMFVEQRQRQQPVTAATPHPVGINGGEPMRGRDLPGEAVPHASGRRDARGSAMQPACGESRGDFLTAPEQLLPAVRSGFLLGERSIVSLTLTR